jgi:hypothetical protein
MERKHKGVSKCLVACATSMSDVDDGVEVVDLDELHAGLKDAALSAVWEHTHSDQLLLLLTSLSEHIGSQMAACRRDVNQLCDDVKQCSSEFANVSNSFVLLSQTQFIEARCDNPEDDSDSDDSISHKEGGAAKSVVSVTDETTDRTEVMHRLYLHAVDLSVQALEQRTIPLYDSDSEEEESEEGEEDEEPLLGPESGDETDKEDAEGAEGEAAARPKLSTFKDRYKNRPLMPLIGSLVFMNDPCIGLGRRLEVARSESSGAVSGASDTDSDAEPIYARGGTAVSAVQPSPQLATSGAPPPAANVPSGAPQAYSAPPAPPAPSAPPAPKAPAVPAPFKLDLFAGAKAAASDDEEDAVPVAKAKPMPKPAPKFGATSAAMFDPGEESDASPVPPKAMPKKQHAKPAVVSDDETPAKPAAKVSLKLGGKAKAFDSGSDEDAAPVGKKKAPAPAPKGTKKAFDSGSESEAPAKPMGKKQPAKSAAAVPSDSETDTGMPYKPKTSMAKKSAAIIGSDTETETDVPTMTAKKAMPKPAAKKTMSKQPVYSDTETENESAAPPKAVPKPAAKKTVPKPAFSETDTDAPAPVSAKVAPKMAAKKAPAAAQYSDTETETDAGFAPKTAMVKTGPGKTKSLPVVSDTETETDAGTAAKPMPKPAPKKAPPKSAPSKAPVSDTETEAEAPPKPAAAAPPKATAPTAQKKAPAVASYSDTETETDAGVAAKKVPPKPAVKKAPAPPAAVTETETEAEAAAKPASPTKMVASPLKKAPVPMPPPTDTEAETTDATPAAKAPVPAPKAPGKAALGSDSEEDPAAPKKVPTKKLIMKKMPALPKKAPAKVAPAPAAATASESEGPAPVAAAPKKMPAFAGKKAVRPPKSVLESSDEDKDGVKAVSAPKPKLKMGAPMPRPKAAGKGILGSDSD